MIGVERKELNNKARHLRNNMTGAEIILWSRLKSRQIDGFKFRRQQPIFEYIVDFYCHDLRLVIEIDGGIHSLPEIIESDKYREKILKINGFHVIRFTNHEIKTNLKSSLKKFDHLSQKSATSTMSAAQTCPPSRRTIGSLSHEQRH